MTGVGFGAGACARSIYRSVPPTSTSTMRVLKNAVRGGMSTVYRSGGGDVRTGQVALSPFGLSTLYFISTARFESQRVFLLRALMDPVGT